MLVAPGHVLSGPARLAGLPVDHHDGAEASEAEHHAPVLQRETGVGVGELVPAAAVAELPPVQVQVAPGMPFPHRFARGRDLPHVVAVGDPVALAAGLTAPDPGGHVGRDRLPADVDGVAVGPPAEVVVLGRVAVLPHHLAVPCVFPQQPPLAAAQGRPLVHPTGPQQVAVGQQVGVVSRAQGKAPLVQHLAPQPDEVRLPRRLRHDEGVTRRRLRPVVNQHSHVPVSHGCRTSRTAAAASGPPLPLTRTPFRASGNPLRGAAMQWNESVSLRPATVRLPQRDPAAASSRSIRPPARKRGPPAAGSAPRNGTRRSAGRWAGPGRRTRSSR